jgi:aminodeoxyfutalosine deaminase
MPTTLRARYVFPVAGEPISDGTVSFEGERIIAIGPYRGQPHARNLGNAAILPGLVNAHAHLDFSDLAAPLGRRGIQFVDWLRCVREHRRRDCPDLRVNENGTVPFTAQESLGLVESLRGGVTAIGDIVQPHRPSASSPVEVTAFLELIAPTVDRVAAAAELAEEYLISPLALGEGPGILSPLPLGEGPGVRADEQLGNDRKRHAPDALTLTLSQRERGRILPGLSPHAPYSVHADLLAAVVALSQEHQVPVAMHLAESPEELEWLQSGGGLLQELLAEFGAWDETAKPRAAQPLDYLRLLATAHRALVVHGNYLDDEEIGFLAANAQQMSVVYCPRSHDWFSYRAYPLEKMLAAGVAVALGTDGRGSSPDLSLFDAMRFAGRRHPSVGLDVLLRMATLEGARSLGRNAAIGSLAPGHRADLAIVALPNLQAANPHELLFDPAASVVGCFCRGEET